MFYSDLLDLGHLDPAIYRCITPEIITDRVAISSRQIHHIAERHPDAYEDVMESLRQAIRHPDYILRDRGHTNTGLVVHRLADTNESLYIVLRICTRTDPRNDVNTIITGWKVGPKRLMEYLRREQILYSSHPPC